MTGLLEELTRFDRIELSRIAGHPKSCCAMVRHGVFARLTQFHDIGAALAAVPELFRWGPVQWPAYWCELAEHGELTGDCGVHADVAAAVLLQEGVPHVRARAALLTQPLAPPHWQASWNEAQAGVAWIGRTLVHHEVIRVGDRWWDPSEAGWFSGAGAHLASGHVLAVREDGGQWQIAPDASAALDLRLAGSVKSAVLRTVGAAAGPVTRPAPSCAAGGTG